MSWDEKDWAYTNITGKRYRLNLLFRRFVFDEEDEDAEINFSFYAYSRELCEMSDMDLHMMETIAENYGIKIEYQYLGHYRYCFDYTNKEPKNIDLKTRCPLFCLSEPLGNVLWFSNKSFYDIGSNLSIYKRRNVDLTEKDLKEDLAIVESYLLKILKKLSNEKFVAHAPAAVIELERKKQADAESIIKSLKESIAALKKA